MGNENTFLCFNCMRDRWPHQRAVICTECVNSLLDRRESKNSEIDKLDKMWNEARAEADKARKEREALLKVLIEDEGYMIGDAYRTMQSKMEEQS